MTRSTRRLFCISATLCAAVLVASEVPGGGTADSPVISRIYFIPFDVTTYVPVTVRDIERVAHFEMNLVGPEGKNAPHRFAMLLRGMIRARPAQAPLGELFVRLKLVLKDETYFVDAAGGVLEVSSNRTFRLEKKELRRIEQTIEGFSGVVDIKAFTRAYGGPTSPK